MSEIIFPSLKRWIDHSGEKPPAGWLPFGTGLRRCPGSQLANTTLKLALEAIFGRLVVVPVVQDQGDVSEQ
jgi:cytochrome P450